MNIKGHKLEHIIKVDNTLVDLSMVNSISADIEQCTVTNKDGKEKASFCIKINNVIHLIKGQDLESAISEFTRIKSAWMNYKYKKYVGRES